MAVFCGIAYGLLRGDVATWPLMPWSMYARSRADPPPASAERWEARCRDAGGGTWTLTAGQLLPIENVKMAQRALRVSGVEAAAGGPGPQTRLLVNLIRRASGRTPAEVEIWRLEWDVRPFALPPMNRDRPRAAERVAAFRVTPDLYRPRDLW